MNIMLTLDCSPSTRRMWVPCGYLQPRAPVWSVWSLPPALSHPSWSGRRLQSLLAWDSLSIWLFRIPKHDGNIKTSNTTPRLTRFLWLIILSLVWRTKCLTRHSTDLRAQSRSDSTGLCWGILECLGHLGHYETVIQLRLGTTMLSLQTWNSAKLFW